MSGLFQQEITKFIASNAVALLALISFILYKLWDKGIIGFKKNNSNSLERVSCPMFQNGKIESFVKTMNKMSENIDRMFVQLKDQDKEREFRDKILSTNLEALGKSIDNLGAIIRDVMPRSQK